MVRAIKGSIVGIALLSSACGEAAPAASPSASAVDTYVAVPIPGETASIYIEVTTAAALQDFLKLKDSSRIDALPTGSTIVCHKHAAVDSSVITVWDDGSAAGSTLLRSPVTGCRPEKRHDASQMRVEVLGRLPRPLGSVLQGQERRANIAAPMIGGPDVSPRDWLLILLDGADQPLDRIRIQKAMFLFAQVSKAPAEEKYTFRPYHYGPFSFAIYPDLEDLVRLGLIRAEAAGNSVCYLLTTTGQTELAKFRARLPHARAVLLRSLRDWVMQRDFRRLLTDIYRLYPDYAVNSIFR